MNQYIIKDILGIVQEKNIRYYNSTENEIDMKNKSELLSDPTKSQYDFFQDYNQIAPLYHNKFQKNPGNDKYISSYGQKVDKVSCNNILCGNSFNDSDMI